MTTATPKAWQPAMTCKFVVTFNKNREPCDSFFSREFPAEADPKTYFTNGYDPEQVTERFYRETDPEAQVFAVFGTVTRSPAADPKQEKVETFPERLKASPIYKASEKALRALREELYGATQKRILRFMDERERLLQPRFCVYDLDPFHPGVTLCGRPATETLYPRRDKPGGDFCSEHYRKVVAASNPGPVIQIPLKPWEKQ